MVRAKEFERDVALRDAIPVFAHHGYAGASTSLLLQAMGISRQSMYDTYGDKRRLYLAALQDAVAESVAGRLQAMSIEGSAIRRLEMVVEHVVAQSFKEPYPKCLAVSSICEFGHSDSEIHAVNDAAKITLKDALVVRLSEAKTDGDIRQEIDIPLAAEYLTVYFLGIELAARGGASEQSLCDMGKLIISSLR
jgi:TetR/AcrR family transcriptional regulator, transcriptional repressor for nem operon